MLKAEKCLKNFKKNVATQHKIFMYTIVFILKSNYFYENYLSITSILFLNFKRIR